jgi:predicted TIM-barrel fold metal-dependent hydrolase
MNPPPLPVFDAHLHIIDERFPLVANAGYLPPQFTADAYRAAVASLGVCGGAIVSGSFQALDQSYLRDALDRLGPTFVGVTQLPRTAEDAEIRDLDRCGVRAVRFNLRRGGSEGIEALEEMAERVYALVGWHAEFYADARELGDLVPRLRALPQIVIDHLGLSAEGLPTVLELVATGAKVKATGFGRIAFDVPPALRAIADIDPHALLFGTDLPSTRAPRPFAATDVALVVNALGEERARLALYDNAAALYRPRETTGRAAV